MDHLINPTMGIPMTPASETAPDSSSARKRVSQACQPCAKRKTKCDGGLPNCGQCRQRDITECTYAESKRNKRTRKSSPQSFQRPQGFGDQGTPYTPSSRPENGNGNIGQLMFRHEPARAPKDSYSALDHLSTVASARAQSTTPAQFPLPRISPNRSNLAVSSSTSTALLKTYFDTIHPMWPILYKPWYELTGLENVPNSMPIPLLYAIYSIAACVQQPSDFGDDNPTDIPSPQHTFEAALQALNHSGLLKPKIETCQAITILALQQHGIAESASAALLCGLASSMAIELRLHRAMGPDANSTEVQVKSRLWWNIYILDKLLSCELGRPALLRLDEQDTPYPSASESDEYQLLELRMSGDRVSTVKTRTISGFHTSIQITIIMESISREIYSVSGRKAISEGAQSVEDSRNRIGQSLKEYLDMLEGSPLKLDRSGSAVAAPVSITNYVWMWCSIILLHRPFLTQTNRADSSSLDGLHTCFHAASSICSILEGYSANLPMLTCDLVFPIFTAASTLSYCAKQLGQENIEVRKQIDMCVGWLRVLGKSWKVASTRQELLSKDFRPLNRPNNSTPDPSGRSPLHYTLQPVAPMIQSGAPSDAQITDDWSFLEHFGDPADEFYTMNANFRELLQTQLDGPAT